MIPREELRVRRKSMRISQRQVAERLGCSISHICDLEAGSSRLTDEIARRIHRELDHLGTQERPQKWDPDGNFGLAMTIRRRRMGASQRQVAERLGCSITKVRNMETLDEVSGKVKADVRRALDYIEKHIRPNGSLR